MCKPFFVWSNDDASPVDPPPIPWMTRQTTSAMVKNTEKDLGESDEYSGLSYQLSAQRLEIL